MARKNDDKNTAPEKPAGTRRGLRSQSEATPTPAPDAGQPGPSRPEATRPKRASKKRRLEKIEDVEEEDEEKEDEKKGSKKWLENERERRVRLLGDAQRAVSIDGFDMHLRDRDEGRRSNRRADIIRANAAVGGGGNFDRNVRQRRHDARVRETSMYEDFMYFQSPRRRAQYEEDTTRKKKNPFRKGGTAGRLWMSGPDENLQLRRMIEEFEARQIGILENLGPDGIGPNDLHTLVPGLRREPVGLGERDLRRTTQEVNLSRLNHEAIERERANIEGDPGEEGTHSARRVDDAAAMGTLPTDRWINDVVPTARSMHRTRLQSGLFISAGEKSSDWLTSYDHLDIVKPGVYAIERHLLPASDPRRKPMHRSSKEEEEIPQPDPDCDGYLNEFCKPKRKHKRFKHVQTTLFAEATYGRREREHIHMFLPPSSPIHSPPHAPNYNSHIPADIPSTHPEYKYYRAKFRDNFGVTYKSWPGFHNSDTGYTVRYEPLDIPALPENLQKQYMCDGEVLGDPEILDDSRTFEGPALEGTSMRLLREAKGEPYREPIRPLPGERESESSDGADGDEEEEESDDDGDLFRKAYLEASRGVATGHGGTSGGGGAGDDENGGGSDDDGAGGDGGGSAGGEAGVLDDENGGDSGESEGRNRSNSVQPVPINDDEQERGDNMDERGQDDPDDHFLDDRNGGNKDDATRDIDF